MKQLIIILTLLVAFCISTNAQTVEDLFKTYRTLIKKMPTELEKDGVTYTATPVYKLVKKKEIQKLIKEGDCDAEQVDILEKAEQIEILSMLLTDNQRKVLSAKLNNLSGFTRMTEKIKNSDDEPSDNIIQSMAGKVMSSPEKYQANLYGKMVADKLINILAVLDWMGMTIVIHLKGEFPPEQTIDVESLFENQ